MLFIFCRKFPKKKIGNWLCSYWFSMWQLIGSLNTESHKTLSPVQSFTTKRSSTITQATIHLHRPQSFTLGRLSCDRLLSKIWWKYLPCKGICSWRGEAEMCSLTHKNSPLVCRTRTLHSNLFTYPRWKSISEKSLTSPQLFLKSRLSSSSADCIDFVFHENNLNLFSLTLMFSLLSSPTIDFRFVSSHLKLFFLFSFCCVSKCQWQFSVYSINFSLFSRKFSRVW